MVDELNKTSDHIAQIEATLTKYVENNEHCALLSTIPGIGVINASALVCKVGNGAQFDSARALCVSLGLTPKLHASGLRSQMLGISKRGDPYIRKQLIHGARALLMFCEKRPNDALCRWAARLKKRRGTNVAVVAVANRMARLAWTLLQKQESYRPMPV